MKHYSAAALARHVDRVFVKPSVTPDELKGQLRAQLDGTRLGKLRLAARLGISAFHLTRLLRSAAPVPDKVAARMGFRKITRFERTD